LTFDTEPTSIPNNRSTSESRCRLWYRKDPKLLTDQAVGRAKGFKRPLQLLADKGGTAFIMFKSNAKADKGGIWGKMFHFFSFNREEFLAHYHKRSNVESTMSMIKAKFRDHVRSKTDVAMKNEVLCKVLCHNICCVIGAMYELGIQPVFNPPN
jgi:hypothetical protein